MLLLFVLAWLHLWRAVLMGAGTKGKRTALKHAAYHDAPAKWRYRRTGK